MKQRMAQQDNTGAIGKTDPKSAKRQAENKDSIEECGAADPALQPHHGI